MRRSSGFSIIELVLIAAVVSVLILAGGFGVRALLEASRLSEAITTVQTQTAEARRIAKRLDRTVELSIQGQDGVWSVIVDGRQHQLTGVSVESGEIEIELDPPFGTYSGRDEVITLRIGNRTADVTITGVLARTVVSR